LLYADCNYGNPRVRVRNGVYEVVEIWPIFRLVQMGWKPTNEYAGHVLAAKIWRPGRNGVYAPGPMQVAADEERKLSRQEFRGLMNARKTVESAH